MQDMVAGRYQLPWAVQVTDGTPCGFCASRAQLPRR